MTQKIILSGILLLVCSAAQGMQQAQAPRIQSTSASLPAQNYLKTISSWLSDNPYAALAALGITSGLGGYFLYSKAQALKDRQKQLNLSQELQEPRRPMVARNPLVDATPRRIYTAAPMTFQQRQNAPRVYQSPTQQLQPSLQKQDVERKYEAQAQTKATIPLFMRKLFEEYKVSPSAQEVIAAYNNGRIVLHNLLQPDEPGEWILVEKNRDVAFLIADDIRNLMWFIYIYSVSTQSSFLFPQNVKFFIKGADSHIKTVYNALRTSQAESFSDIVESVYYMDIGQLPPRNNEVLSFAEADSQLYLWPHHRKPSKITDTMSKAVQHLIELGKKKLSEETLAILEQFNVQPDDDAAFQQKYEGTDLYNQATDYIQEADLEIAQHLGTAPQFAELPRFNISRDIIPLLTKYEFDAALQKINPRLHQNIARLAQELIALRHQWQQRHELKKIELTFDELLKAPAMKYEKDITSEAIGREQRATYY